MGVGEPQKSQKLKLTRRWVLLGTAGILLACILVAALSALSNARLPSRSPTVDRLGERDRAQLAEAQHLRRSVGEAVWPGWGQADIPAPRRQMRGRGREPMA